MTLGPYKVVFFDLGDTLVIAKNGWVTGARHLLTDLQQNGVRLGIISNTGNLTRKELLAYLPPDFDLKIFEENLIILSSEVGVEKPSLDIFRKAIARDPDLKPSDCLFCTESLLDSLAAQQVGMHAARIQKQLNSDIETVSEELGKL